VRQPFIAVTAVGVAALLVLACGGEAPTEPTGSPGQPGGEMAQAPTLPQLLETVRSHPEDVQARHAVAIALHQAGRREEAIEHFEQVVALNPDTVHLIELGVAYASVSRGKEAENAFTRALESSPNHPIVLHHLGNLAEARGEKAEAISLYRQSVEHDPAYLIAQFHLAEALRASGQFADAYRGYEAVIQLEPTAVPELEAFDTALLRMAELDLQMGATERAVQLLKVLIEAAPEHAEAHLVLGRAYEKLGRMDEARREFAIHERLTSSAAGSPGQAGPS